MNILSRGASTRFNNKPIKDIFYRNLNGAVSEYKYGNYIVRISRNENEYLRLSCSSQDLLFELIPIGDEVMNSKIIASYLMDNKDYDELMPTAEWDSNPSRRQRELIEKENLGFDYENLRIYNDYEVKSKDRSNVKRLN